MLGAWPLAFRWLMCAMGPFKTLPDPVKKYGRPCQPLPHGTPWHPPASNPMQETESQLPFQLKMMLWLQDRLRSKMSFPVIADVVKADPKLPAAAEEA